MIGVFVKAMAQWCLISPLMGPAVTWLQVTKSLVDHLNSSMKAAIDKADDAEAEVSHARAQVSISYAALQRFRMDEVLLCMTCNRVLPCHLQVCSGTVCWRPFDITKL